MKNIQTFDSIGARFKFLESLFKTEVINCKQVKEVVLAAAQIPIFVFEYSDELEWSHFSSWWSGLALRYDRYENDYVNDLYYVHELHHIAHRKIGFNDFESWKSNKLSEEFESSLFSEMLVYIWMPWLRAKTFNKEILLDRVENPTEEKCRAYRKLTIDLPWTNCDAELVIQKYTRNNHLWADIWQDKANEIEDCLSLISDFDANSISNVIDYLNQNSEDKIPFKDKAILFQEKMER